MGYWNKEICGFQPNDNAERTLPEYTDEQIMEMLSQGRLTVGQDGLPKIEPFSEPTAEEKQRLYESKVDSLIRSKYTLSQELAILRQQESKSDEYKAYFYFCEQCKINARKEVYGDEI